MRALRRRRPRATDAGGARHRARPARGARGVPRARGGRAGRRADRATRRTRARVAGDGGRSPRTDTDMGRPRSLALRGRGAAPRRGALHGRPRPGAARAATPRSLRSPFAHARIAARPGRARSRSPACVGVLTGADVAALSQPFPVGDRLAESRTTRPRPTTSRATSGEPLAVVVARDRYIAEDALELIERRLRAARRRRSTPRRARERRSHDRSFSLRRRRRRAFAGADLVVRETFRVPALDVHAGRVLRRRRRLGRGRRAAHGLGELPGPVHAARRRGGARSGCRARTLRLHHPARLGRLASAIKSAVYAYVVLMGLASRQLGVPVRWTEDRLEHLAGELAARPRGRRRSRPASPQDGELLALALRRDRGRRRVRPRPRAGHALPDARLALGRLPRARTSPRATASSSRTAARPGSTAGFGGPAALLRARADDDDRRAAARPRPGRARAAAT